MASAFVKAIATHAKSSRRTNTDDMAALCDAYAGSACGTGLTGLVDEAFAALLDHVMDEVQRAPFDRKLSAVCRQGERDFRTCEAFERQQFGLGA